MALLPSYHIEVAQCLRGMFAAAVTRINYRYRGILGRDLCRAVGWMAEHDDVRVCGDNPHCVGEACTLCGRRGMHVRRANDGSPQAMHRRFKAQPRSGRRFIKQGGHDQAFGDSPVSPRSIAWLKESANSKMRSMSLSGKSSIDTRSDFASRGMLY